MHKIFIHTASGLEKKKQEENEPKELPQQEKILNKSKYYRYNTYWNHSGESQLDTKLGWLQGAVQCTAVCTRSILYCSVYKENSVLQCLQVVQCTALLTRIVVYKEF